MHTEVNQYIWYDITSIMDVDDTAHNKHGGFPTSNAIILVKYSLFIHLWMTQIIISLRNF